MFPPHDEVPQRCPVSEALRSGHVNGPPCGFRWTTLRVLPARRATMPCGVGGSTGLGGWYLHDPLLDVTVGVLTHCGVPADRGGPRVRCPGGGEWPGDDPDGTAALTLSPAKDGSALCAAKIHRVCFEEFPLNNSHETRRRFDSPRHSGGDAARYGVCQIFGVTGSCVG